MLSRQAIGKATKGPRQEPFWGAAVKTGDPTPSFLSIFIGF